jgi:hypothetical protein
MAELVGKSFRKSKNFLALFLLQVEKVRMRTDFKNAHHFKSNSLFVPGIKKSKS